MAERSLGVEEVLSELRRFWGWLSIVRPMRVFVSSAGDDFGPEKEIVGRALREVPGVAVLGRADGTPRSAPDSDADVDLSDLRSAVRHADIVVFLTRAAETTSRLDPLAELTFDMEPVSLASHLGRRALAWGLVRPFPDDEALLPHWDGDLQSLRDSRATSSVTERDTRTALNSVLKDRDRRLMREAWKGKIESVEALETRVAAEVGRAATRVRLISRARRVLAAGGSAVLCIWFLFRYGFFGLLLVLALVGGAYLWSLNRRWDESDV